MPTVHANHSLKTFNTFGIDVKAKYFVEIHHETDLIDLFKQAIVKQEKYLIIGGGSNLLFTQDFDGLVIHLANKGISVDEQGEDIYVSAQAGEVWHPFVLFCVEHGYGGLENLSLIPGTVGASPVQNIGAYGVELKDVFYRCRAFEIETGSIRTFSLQECEFSYRDSVFKSRLKNQYIITEVSFKLTRSHKIKTTYGAIQDELNRRDITSPSIKDISDVVSAIRVSKLPDPSTIGNAGSFFKNPIISAAEFAALETSYPHLPHYPTANGQIKMPAGWLIERCGFKGMQHGRTGTWKNQALVLVNLGGASGKEIFDFSQIIIDTVFQQFGIKLEREVNLI